MKIAWIGLGTMGEFMAGHLMDAGHELTVHNRTRDREGALAERGARRAETPAEAARGADLVCICVADSPDVEAVVLGPGGVAEGIASGAVVLDCSTIAPDTARRVASELASRGAGAVDAPVSGGSEGARKGQLTAFVGGEDEHVAIARPALEAFCKSITHLGGPGAGQAGKAVNQVLISGTYAALGEGLALGEKEGLPLEALVEALGGGAAGSWILQNRSANVINSTYPLGFRMALHLKDLRIALAEADRLGLPMEVTRLVTEHAAAARRLGSRRRGLLVAGARRARRNRVIERYLQIRAATVAGHLPSGELGYLADVTGLLQLWRIAPDGLHEQVTFGSERITAALASPSEERWVVARDAGGNERHALFSIDADGGSELALTDDPAAIHVPGAFSPDGSRVAFTHTGRNGVDFDVAVVRLDGGGRSELAQPGGWSHVTDWSEDGILVRAANTPFDHDLFLVDPGTGALTHLRRTRARSLRLAASPAGRLASLCACDAGRVHAPRAAAPGRRTGVPDGGRRRRRERRPGRSRTRRAWVVNRGGASEVWLDGERVADLPDGVVSALAFAPGRRADLTAGQPDDSTDVWVAPAGRARTRSAVGGLDRAAFVRPMLERVRASTAAEPVPPLRPAGRADALLGARRARVAVPAAARRPSIQYLCAQGITVAAPNVRGSTGYGRSYHHLDDVERRLDSVSDLAALGRALGAGSGTPVGVMGGSYGGYMTMAAVTEHPELWSCAVNIVGIVNFVTFLERTGAYRRALREAEYGSLERDRAFLESISPIRKIDRIACPLMVIHGANDPRVPVGEAEQVVAALQARGAPVEYLRYEDEGHGITRLPNRLDCYPRVAAFLQEHLL